MNQYASFESMTQTQLMNCINEVSFALDDLLLYLDTHPYDCKALQYAEQFTRQRNAAVAVYSRRFEPLTIDSMEVSQDRSIHAISFTKVYDVRPKSMRFADRYWN